MVYTTVGLKKELIDEIDALVDYTDASLRSRPKVIAKAIEKLKQG